MKDSQTVAPNNDTKSKNTIETHTVNSVETYI